MTWHWLIAGYTINHALRRHGYFLHGKLGTSHAAPPAATLLLSVYCKTFFYRSEGSLPLPQHNLILARLRHVVAARACVRATRAAACPKGLRTPWTAGDVASSILLT